ncbi:MAG TPA: hypothetical protein VNE39_16000 [Planctomycetota bacterium]|nr:hypothetical protein [Planctomycetota bacterium]
MRGNLVRHLAALAGVALLAAGCLDSKAVLTVNPDGSATLEHTLYLKKQKDDKELKLEELKANVEKGVSELGEGVAVASVAAAEAREGWKGFKIVYSVADVSKLKVGYLPPIGAGKADEADLMRFEFKGGAVPKLTIVRPPIKVGEDKEDAKEEENAQMAAAFEGAVLEFHLAVKGTILTTNAEHVNAAKNGLILFREDLGGLLKDKQALATVKAMSKIKDAEVLRTKLKDPTVQKYVQMQPEQSVIVTFK